MALFMNVQIILCKRMNYKDLNNKANHAETLAF